MYSSENEKCSNCGSDNVITLSDQNGTYEHCNDCGHDERS